MNPRFENPKFNRPSAPNPAFAQLQPDLEITIIHNSKTGQTGMRTNIPANPLYISMVLQDTVLNVTKQVLAQSAGLVNPNGSGLQENETHSKTEDNNGAGNGA